MKVQIQYFKKNGTYYSEGEYETNVVTMADVFKEVVEKFRIGDCPGLKHNAVLRNQFSAYILVPEAESNLIHPGLFVTYPNEEEN